MRHSWSVLACAPAKHRRDTEKKATASPRVRKRRQATHRPAASYEQEPRRRLPHPSHRPAFRVVPISQTRPKSSSALQRLSFFMFMLHERSTPEATAMRRRPSTRVCIRLVRVTPVTALLQKPAAIDPRFTTTNPIHRFESLAPRARQSPRSGLVLPARVACINVQYQPAWSLTVAKQARPSFLEKEARNFCLRCRELIRRARDSGVKSFLVLFFKKGLLAFSELASRPVGIKP